MTVPAGVPDGPRCPLCRIPLRAVTGVTVEPCDGHPVSDVLLDELQRTLKPRPLLVAARLIEILDPLDHLVAVRRSERLDAVPLHGRRDERVAFASSDDADTYVADEPHWESDPTPSPVYGVPTLPAPRDSSLAHHSLTLGAAA